MDLVETYRDLGSSLTDLYLSNVSNRMNEIMKVLTVFAAIFIPLGFITGVYGMDVEHPRRAWWWDLPFVFSLMGADRAAAARLVRAEGMAGGGGVRV